MDLVVVGRHRRAVRQRQRDGAAGGRPGHIDREHRFSAFRHRHVLGFNAGHVDARGVVVGDGGGHRVTDVDDILIGACQTPVRAQGQGEGLAVFVYGVINRRHAEDHTHRCGHSRSNGVIDILRRRVNRRAHVHRHRAAWLAGQRVAGGIHGQHHVLRTAFFGHRVDRAVDRAAFALRHRKQLELRHIVVIYHDGAGTGTAEVQLFVIAIGRRTDVVDRSRNGAAALDQEVVHAGVNRDVGVQSTGGNRHGLDNAANSDIEYQIGLRHVIDAEAEGERVAFDHMADVAFTFAIEHADADFG